MRELSSRNLIYLTSVFVSLGVFCHGYDQGVMSGIITGVYFKEYFNHPSRAEIGTVVAVLEIGALVSALCAGRVGDIIGRKRTICIGATVFVVGGLFQTFASVMPVMIVGRIISGLGVGFLSTIVPVYQSEISPPSNRGKLACIEFTGNIIGYCSSVWVDYFCSYIESDLSWRLPLLGQCIIGTMLAVGSLLVVETPRWLINHDHDQEGLYVVSRLYANGDSSSETAQVQFAEIKEAVRLHRLEGEHSYSYMFKRYGRRVFIACSSQAFAQLNGINIISYYAPLVFEQAGWIGRSAILMTGINAICYVLSTVPPWYLIDRLGRRVILISGGIVMAISLVCISYFMFMDIAATPTLVVVFVILYNSFFGYSWGPVPWMYPPEILALSIRVKGASLSTASNWLFNFLIGILAPILQEKMGWAMYLIPAFFCACSVITVYLVYPETKGVRLEQMDALFGDKKDGMSVLSREDREQLLARRNRNSINEHSENISSEPTRPSAAALARGDASPPLTAASPRMSRLTSMIGGVRAKKKGYTPLNSLDQGDNSD